MAESFEYPAPRDLRCPFEPASAYTDLLPEGELTRVRLWDGSEPWLVTGYEDARDVLRDNRFSVNPDIEGYPHITEALVGYRKSARETFINKDNPQHNNERRMFTKWFTVKRIEASRPAIQRIVDAQMSALLEGPNPVDFLEAFALPIPSLVIFDLLNAPYDAHERIQHETFAMLSWRSTAEEATSASARLLDFARELIEDRMAHPLEDDVLTTAIQEYLLTGRCTMEQLAQGTRQLFLAGHETTANQMTLCTLALIQNPEQRAEFVASTDPAFIANAIDELQRYLTLDQSGRARAALEDVVVGGQLIRKGEGVIVSLESCNRDTRIFENPSVLDFHRPNSKDHATYGQGIHRCLGERLAQVELQLSLKTLFDRLPDLRCAVPYEDLEFKTDHTVYGMRALPVTWGS